jgi:phosphatidylglycerophosphate synthase
MTPNQVTAVSAVFTYSAIVLLMTVAPSALMAAGVALLLLLGYAFDSADGQLARLTRMGRPSGEWLDHVIDMGKLCLLNGAVAISWVRWGVPGLDAGAWAVALPLFNLAVVVVSFFGWLLSDLLVRINRAKHADLVRPAPAPRASALRSILRLPSDYGLFALTFVWFATPAFLITYAALFAANTAILLAALPAWFRQVRSTEEVP